MRLLVRRLPVTQRGYHYDKDIYGFRSPRVFEMPDYTPEELENRIQNSNLLRLVQQYRIHGHRMADLDPLGLMPKDNVYQLTPARFGISDTGDQRYKLSGILHVGKTSNPSISKDSASIGTILEHLKKTYTGGIGFEFSHIPSASERRWFATLVESFDKRQLSPEEKLQIHSLLTKSEVFDNFMARKFPQVKRYGLEGAEGMLVVLDALFKDACIGGVSDIILSMPHRGRLNLLSVMLDYPHAALFSKVKGNSEFPKSCSASGDVLSHLGASVDLDYGGKNKLHISLIQNSSHLEAANPVALGKARARQAHLLESSASPECALGDRVMCIQIHGDAAFTGQGVVTETLGLSNLPHFTAGGSVHIIVNNQIGYTTPAMNARSSLYTSDIGKMINCPVIHVNSDNPEEVAYAASLAFEYRNKFRKDIIIDLISYRRMGHNELDEPAFTQPLMYHRIRGRISVPKTYEKSLMTQKLLNEEHDCHRIREKYDQELDAGLIAADSFCPPPLTYKGKWEGITNTNDNGSSNTGVPEEDLRKIGSASVAVPSGMLVHPRVLKYHIEGRLTKLQQGTVIDWATAEALAFGSLLKEGSHIRISGQDVGRGTFSQRHAMLVDQNTERTFIPLNHMHRHFGEINTGKLEIANSSLSEFAVLGFEYGLSLEDPRRLCIWEAQFGDFFNGAQVIIDAFIASGEAKWQKQSGLVLLLPHGYDGGGPEHSSARIERFLQLSDESIYGTSRDPNWHVTYPTTPAQFFHLLRRQLHRNYRKPLIVAGPKALLRLPQAVSRLGDMAPNTSFLPVIDDVSIKKTECVSRVCFMSGKIYYDLFRERESKKSESEIALIRIEEICPAPMSHIRQLIQKYSHVIDWVWVQEEPENNGSFLYFEPRIRSLLSPGCKLRYQGRPPTSAVATGITKVHKEQHKQIIEGALSLEIEK